MTRSFDEDMICSMTAAWWGRQYWTRSEKPRSPGLAGSSKLKAVKSLRRTAPSLSPGLGRGGECLKTKLYLYCSHSLMRDGSIGNDWPTVPSPWWR
jgi:hypothetical protein